MNAINESAAVQPESADQQLSQGAIDLREFASVVIGSWPIILLAMALGFGIGRFLVFVATPTYTTDALVQVDSDTATEVVVGQITSGIAPALPRETEIELLKSRNVLGSVARRLGLDISARPHQFSALGVDLGGAYARAHRGEGFGAPPFWLRPFALPEQAWGGEDIAVTTFEVPKALIGQAFQIRKLEADGFELLEEDGQLLATGRIGAALEIPVVATEGTDHGQLQLFVQRLEARPGTVFTLRKLPLDVAVQRLRAGFSTRESRAPGIMTLRFRGNEPERIARILTEILNTYQSQNIARRSEQAEQTLAFLVDQIPIVRERVETAEAQLNQFRIENGTADLDQETANVLSRSLELEQRRSDLIGQREESLQRFTTAHPVVVSIDSQIERVDEQIARVTARVDKLPGMQQEALRIQREATLATSLYTALLNRRQEIEMVRAGTTGSIRIIDSPLVAKEPVAPDAAGIVAFSTAAGFGIGVTLIIVLFLLRTGVEDPSKVEQKTGLPNYGNVPFSSKQRRAAGRIFGGSAGPADRLLAVMDPSSLTIESIRSVRTALRFAQFDATDNVTMFTSPAPGVGKSFLSMNLGAVIASGGDRVVVVDADLRRGYLHKVAGVERAPGLSEVISGDAQLEDVVHKSIVKGLYTITTGTLPPNPSEILISETFLQILRKLSESFDQVIIDTPPILAVTEAADIGRHCGTTIVVLQAGSHSMRMIEDTITRLRRAGVRVRGTVFNQVGKSRAARYGYNYGYYGNYYSDYRYEYKPTAARISLPRRIVAVVQQMRARLPG